MTHDDFPSQCLSFLACKTGTKTMPFCLKAVVRKQLMMHLEQDLASLK